jgi:hypothetical protein
MDVRRSEPKRSTYLDFWTAGGAKRLETVRIPWNLSGVSLRFPFSERIARHWTGRIVV